MNSTANAMLIDPVNDFPKSRIRRKPVFTYKSPSANDVDPCITYSTGYGSTASSQSTHTDNNSAPASPSVERPKRKKIRVPNYLLPLYHPMGQLALSLPPLDPRDIGLPLSSTSGGSSHRYSRRPRRPPAKIRDEEGEVAVPTVSSIAAVAAHEVKRGSPRKRRMAGVNGKRRRRDAEDGDATYPAKRTRQTRAGGVDDNDLDDVGQGDGDDAPEMDGPVEQRPERRSTRSRTKRRDSSDDAESLADDQPVQGSASAMKAVQESIHESRGVEKEESGFHNGGNDQGTSS